MAKVALTVYFSDKRAHIASTHEMAGALHQITLADGVNSFVMGFDGYAVESEQMTTGMDVRARAVVLKVKELMAQGHDVTLNCYGHGRGAVNALFAARMLRKVKNGLAINMALVDPTAGNAFLTVAMDGLKVTRTNQVIDMSACQPLRNVLCLYSSGLSTGPNAPIFPRYPSGVSVEESVMPGGHEENQKAELFGNQITLRQKPYIVFARVVEFFRQHAVSFNEKLTVNLLTNDNSKIVALNDPALRDVYEAEHALTKASQRQLDGMVKSAHALKPTVIVTEPQGMEFLNLDHRRRAFPGVPTADSDIDCTLKIKHPTPGRLRRLSNFIDRHPYVFGALKWLMIGAAVGGVSMLTAGFGVGAMIAPYVAPYLATLYSAVGAVGFVATMLAIKAVVIGSAAALLWNAVVMPIANLVAKAFRGTDDDSFAEAIVRRKNIRPSFLSSMAQGYQRLGSQTNLKVNENSVIEMLPDNGNGDGNVAASVPVVVASIRSSVDQLPMLNRGSK